MDTNKIRERFEKRFTVNPTRVFFGDPEELKKQGWEVGGDEKLIMKQDVNPEELWQFISDSLQQQREEIDSKAIKIKLHKNCENCGEDNEFVVDYYLSKKDVLDSLTKK